MHSVYKMRNIATHGVAWSVDLSVCPVDRSRCRLGLTRMSPMNRI